MDNKTFISKLAKGMSTDAKTAASLVAALASVLKENAMSLNSVAIPGFGTFTGVKSLEKEEVDPDTGKLMLYPPHIEIAFTPGSMLKKLIANE